MKTVVFGGSGFLGSYTADVLTKAGHDVLIFDIKKSPYLQKGQEMAVGNILDEKAVEGAVKACDYVYNFAGMADIEEAHKKPVETIEHNILGNTLILEACRLNRVKRFIFASTLYVHSDKGSFYRSSKQACEIIIENYNKVFGLPYTILRYSSIYGPRASEANYVHKILKQAVTEGKITSFGQGEDLREYIHVEDAARCSVEILSEEFENQYVIISGAQPMRRKDMLMMINEILGNKIKIEFAPEDPNLHYKITPYHFSPKLAKKYISTYYLDLGQGLLQCLQDIYEKAHPRYKELNGILAPEKKD